jgi:hypothetical protein
MGINVKKARAQVETARVLTNAVIRGLATSNDIRVQGVLPDGRTLTLKRVSLKEQST